MHHPAIGRTIRRRSLLACGGIATLGALAPHHARADASLGTLTFGYGLAADYVPFFVAQEKGFFTARGLDVNFVALPNPGAVPAAVQAGSLHLATTTPTSLLQAAAAGLDLTAVMGITRQTQANKIAALVTRPGVTVHSAKDLVGKQIGAAGLNNILAVIIEKWLMDSGVAPGDVRLAEASFATMPDLLRAGQIDAALVVEPFLSRIVQTGVGVAVPEFLAGTDDLVFAILIGKQSWAAANRPQVAAFTAAAADGLAAVKAHPDEAREIGQKWLKVPVVKLPPYDPAVRPADLQAYVPTLRALKLLTEDVNLGPLIFS